MVARMSIVERELTELPPEPARGLRSMKEPNGHSAGGAVLAPAPIANMREAVSWDAAELPKAPYKRPFDLVLVAAALVVLLPIWLILAIAVPLAIRLEDGGRIFYTQKRVGRAGRVFTMLKFRSMIEDAEKQTGPVLAAPQDVRATKVGRVLRRFHLDELPQLVNVVKGDMSLVGPRPERPELVRQVEQAIPDFRRRLKVRPGIAGLAQVCAGYHAGPGQKLRYDERYIETMNPLLDLKLLFLCVWRVLRPHR